MGNTRVLIYHLQELQQAKEHIQVLIATDIVVLQHTHGVFECFAGILILLGTLIGFSGNPDCKLAIVKEADQIVFNLGSGH